MTTDKTPEKNLQDEAVLKAFSKSLATDEEFRERWKATVEQAEKRREERRAAEQEKIKAEKERLERIERDMNPRVTDENRPGKPLDLQKLSEIAVRRKLNEWEDISDTPKTVESNTENGFVFDVRAVAEDDSVPPSSDADIKLSVTRDRRLKKTVSERTRYFCRTKLTKESLKGFVRKTFPSKGDSTGETVRKCVRIGSLIAFVCALGFLVNYFADYLNRIDMTDEFQEEMSSLEVIPEDELADAWADIKAKYPEVDFPEGMNIKFSELYAINSNVVGWLKIDNTNINTVLLQADDNTYHLRMNIYNEYSRFGNPFVHYNCKMGPDGFSKNTILFGHNANDGLMFHDLINYMSVEGYINAPIVTLDTLYEQTKWKIFAVVLTNANADDDNGYKWRYLYTDFYSDASFNTLLSEIEERNIIHTGVDVDTSDNILTLYTCCTYQVSSGRLAVFARQLREGEDESIDTSKVYYNQNARYPQAWYDKKGKVNPYAPTTAASVQETKASEKNGERQTEEAVTETAETAVTEQTTVAEQSAVVTEEAAMSVEAQTTAMNTPVAATAAQNTQD